MPPAVSLAPTDPPAGPPAMSATPHPNATGGPTPSLTFDLFLTTATTATITGGGSSPAAAAGGGATEAYLQVHSILITAVFSAVCLLLVGAFVYAFCFHCSIRPSPSDPEGPPSRRRQPRPAHHHSHSYSLDREDATYRLSSSDGPSAGNVV